MDNYKVKIEQALVLCNQTLFYWNETWKQLKKASKWSIMGWFGLGLTSTIGMSEAYDVIEQQYEYAKQSTGDFCEKLKSTKLDYDDFGRFADFYMNYSFDAEMEREDLVEARKSIEELIVKIEEIREGLMSALDE